MGRLQHPVLFALSLLFRVSVVSALSSAQHDHKEHKQHGHKEHKEHKEHKHKQETSYEHHKAKESKHEEKSAEDSGSDEVGDDTENKGKHHQKQRGDDADVGDTEGSHKKEKKESSESDDKHDREDDGGDKEDGVGEHHKDSDDEDEDDDQDSDSDSFADAGEAHSASTCGRMYLESEEKDSDHARCEKGWAAGEKRVNGPDGSRNTWWKLGFASGLEAAQRSSVGSKDSCENLSKVVVLTCSRLKYDLPSEEVLDKAGFNEFKEGLGKGFTDGCNRAGEKGKGDLSYGYGYARGYMGAVEESMSPNRNKSPCDYAFARGDSDHGVCDRAFNGGSLMQSQHEKSSGKATRKWYRRGFLKGFRNSLWNKPSKSCVLEAKKAASRVNRHLYDLPGDLHLFTDNDFKVFKEGLRRGMELECRWEQEGSTEKATYAYRFGFYRGYLKALNG